MRLDSALKKSRPLMAYISRHFLMHWMSVKLPDNFQMREHSWPCRFHIKTRLTEFVVVIIFAPILFCSVLSSSPILKISDSVTIVFFIIRQQFLIWYCTIKYIMLYTNSIASFAFYKFYKCFVPLLNKFSQKLYFSKILTREITPFLKIWIKCVTRIRIRTMTLSSKTHFVYINTINVSFLKG
jgi:hypothetical protein